MHFQPPPLGALKANNKQERNNAENRTRFNRPSIGIKEKKLFLKVIGCLISFFAKMPLAKHASVFKFLTPLNIYDMKISPIWKTLC